MSNTVLNAFHSLIEQHPDLFTPQDQADLQPLLTGCPEDLEDLADDLVSWCKTRPALYTALKAQIQEPVKDKLPGQGNTAPVIKAEDWKPMLLNSMHQAFPAPTQSPKS